MEFSNITHHPDPSTSLLRAAPPTAGRQPQHLVTQIKAKSTKRQSRDQLGDANQSQNTKQHDQYTYPRASQRHAITRVRSWNCNSNLYHRYYLSTLHARIEATGYIGSKCKEQLFTESPPRGLCASRRFTTRSRRILLGGQIL